MTLHPILAALRKHKAGVFLIGLQVAFTVAIVCNIIFIASVMARRVDRPTGLDERDLFLVGQSYVNAPAGTGSAALDKLDSMQLTDLAALRDLSDVQDAAPVSTIPLLSSTNTANVSLKPGQLHGFTQADLFFGDAHMLSTFGLRLVAGRDFTGAEVRRRAADGNIDPPLVIVSRALADKLFPQGDAVGKPIYLNENAAPSVIVGVVARLLTSSAEGSDALAYNTIMIPARINAATTLYAVRARGGRVRSAMDEARKALFRVDAMRIMRPEGQVSVMGLHTFAQIRFRGYALEIDMVRILTAICVILLLITGVGMAGLTSFWVNQRQKQIGIRRALGARRIDILRYFQIENLLIAGGGCVVGVVLAIGINLALLRAFAMERMPVWYVVVGVVLVLALGQLAVFVPARRASNVPPVVATRSV